MPALTMGQLRSVIATFQVFYQDYYGYTEYDGADPVNGVLKYHLFRNRDESFDKRNAVIVAAYREE